jgi:inorganic phosphate transporter, PiT family
MSHKITRIRTGPGVAASLSTAVLVIAASRFGVPVSTTHVSNGSLFGIGMVTSELRWKMMATVLVAWVTTLPLGAALGGLAFALLSRLG